MATDEDAKVNRRLGELCARHGELTPEIVIEDARDAASPLHDKFDWDVDSAALSHWKQVATRLINGWKHTVEVRKVEVKVPHVVREPQNRKVFTPIQLIAERQDDSKRDLFKAELTRILNAIDRAKGIAVGLKMADILPELDRAAGCIKAAEIAMRPRHAAAKGKRPEADRRAAPPPA